MLRLANLPYCGAPPVPGEIWARWNLDPILLGLLLLAAAAYGAGARIAKAPRGRVALFGAGWAVLTLALVSPLCPLSVSLFSARVGQHMILTLIAAPLIMLGRPLAVAGALAPETLNTRTPPRRGAPLLSAAVFAALLWFWHAPAPYAATFRGDLVYWTMHVTVIGAACWLWRELLEAPDSQALKLAAVGLFSSVQMGLLGAVITLAPAPLYAPHALTTAVWGLTQLEDQQLGGALMWVPGCAVFLVAALAPLWRLLERQPRRLGLSPSQSQVP